jgi:transposase
MSNTTIGIDISKDHLDVCRLSDGKHRRYRNSQAGHRALIKWLRTTPVERIVYEATGPYHRAFELALGTAGLPMVKVNPRQARRFAEAIGTLAKTDRIDAAMLARMGAMFELKPKPMPSGILNDLKDLRLAHQALIKDRTAAKNRSKHLRLSLLRHQNAERLRQIEIDLEAIEIAIEALIEQDEILTERFAILLSIPGIAKRSAFALLIDMPELGSIEGKQAASLAGLAPVVRQSGSWTGRASIRGGRANLRQAIYMPALVAARFNADLKAKYDALIAAGKPPKVAITAVMRKLLILANALLRDQRKWSPNAP